MSTELTIFARFHVREGMEADAAAALRAQIVFTHNEHGCTAIDAYRSTRDPRLFFIHSCWTDDAAFELHAILPNTNRFIAKMESLADQPLEVTRSHPI